MVTWARPPRTRPTIGVGQIDQALHHAGLEHQFARQDEERDGHQRKRVDRTHHARRQQVEIDIADGQPATTPAAPRPKASGMPSRRRRKKHPPQPRLISKAPPASVTLHGRGAVLPARSTPGAACNARHHRQTASMNHAGAHVQRAHAVRPTAPRLCWPTARPPTPSGPRPAAPCRGPAGFRRMARQAGNREELDADVGPPPDDPAGCPGISTTRKPAASFRRSRTTEVLNAYRNNTCRATSCDHHRQIIDHERPAGSQIKRPAMTSANGPQRPGTTPWAERDKILVHGRSVRMASSVSRRPS
jgi:hypothetical protein